MPNSPASSRTKSAPSYRALGTRSPSMASHEEAEHEYTFVRAIVDAMNNNSQSPPMSPPPAPPPDPVLDPALHPGEWPAMYVTHQPGIDSTQPASPLPFQRHFSQETTPKPTPVLRAKTSIRIEGLSRGKADPTTIQTSSTSVLKSDPGHNGYRYRPRKFSFSSPNAVSDRTVVVPLNSPSMVNLRLTGDVKQMCHPERPSTTFRSPRSRPKSFLLRRNLERRSNTTLDALPTSSKSSNQKLPLFSQQDDTSGDEVTKYRFRLRSAQRNRTATCPRPSTSPEAKSSQPDTADVTLSVDQIPTCDPGDLAHALPERPFKGRFERERNSVKPVLKSATIPRTKAIRSRKGEKSKVEINQKVHPSDVGTASDDVIDGSETSVSGHTRLTKTPGSLSLSVFLPREISSVERSCQRSTLVTPSPRTSRVEATPRDGVEACSTTGDLDSSDDDNEDPGEREDDHEDTSCTLSRRGKAEGSDLRRSIHCELFGPDLCGDCKRHSVREDVKAWQHMVYPGIVADPKVLVAAPMLRRQQAKLGIEPTIPVKPKSAGSALYKSPVGSIKQPVVYSSTSFQEQPPPAQPNQQLYGVHPWRLTGPGSPVTRTLKSVVTQNEIRTRIWKSSESPRSRRQGLAVFV